MPRKYVDKTSFLGGEAGPLLEGRSDLAQFQLGTSPGENFISLKSGGVTRRPGTRYIKNTEGNKEARLIPYIISYNDPTKMFVVEITLASSTSLTFTVIRMSDNASSTVTNGTITVASSINIDEIQYAQSAEFLFLTHESFAPQILYRPTTSTFELKSYIDFSPAARSAWFSMPYRDTNPTTGATLTISDKAVGTGRTVVASAAMFDAGMIGTYFRLNDGGDIYFKITAYTDTTHVTVTVVKGLASAGGSAVTDWAEGAWSTYRGWPRTLCFYSQRLVFGGNTTSPDTFWMSEVADYLQMSIDVGTTALSRPLNFTLASDKLNQICWMVGGKKHTIGTSSAEWVGTVTNDGTNLFVQYDEETAHGSARVQPSKSAYTIPFVQRSGQTLREMAFNFDSDSYQATDLNIFANHVGTPGSGFSQAYAGIAGLKIVQTAHQESPFGVEWCRDSGGRLFGLTRDKQQQIAAWHSHTLGGAGRREDGKPFIRSFCVMPDLFGANDRLWLCVQRTINGVSKYHVEYIDDLKSLTDIAPIGATQSPVINGVTYSLNDYLTFLDCVSLTGAMAETVGPFTGFSRFASSNAYVIGVDDDGIIVHSGVLAVNASGEVTLPVEARTVIVGLHANAYLRLLPIEGGEDPKLHMMGVKRSDKAQVRLHETYGLKVGKHRVARAGGWEISTSFEPIVFESTEFPVLPTFTGVKSVPLPTDADADGSFAFAMEGPWPCTILSICTRVVENEV